jgi:hypothetical protein
VAPVAAEIGDVKCEHFPDSGGGHQQQRHQSVGAGSVRGGRGQQGAGLVPRQPEGRAVPPDLGAPHVRGGVAVDEGLGVGVAVVARQRGEPAQSRLGHASVAETLDTYSHLWPDSDDRTRAAVDSVLGAAVSRGVSRAES